MQCDDLIEVTQADRDIAKGLMDDRGLQRDNGAYYAIALAAAMSSRIQAITALTAQLQELRLELIASHGQTQTALEGKAALTAENERLTAEVAELKDQIDTIYQDMAEG